MVFDVLLGVAAVGDVAGTGDALALAAGVREVPVLLLARLEQRLVLLDLDRLAFLDRKSTRLNSSHIQKSRMPSSA